MKNEDLIMDEVEPKESFIDLPSGNLDLWESVEETNPNYTKKANVKGNKITSISPQYQIKNVTNKFGVYGVTWGLRDMTYDYTLVESLGLVVYSAIFFFPSGSFQINNSISLFLDNAKTKVDDNFAKKLETDTLTKAISKLGFNADIFMGKFEDIRYLNELNEKYKEDLREALSNDRFSKAIELFNDGKLTKEQLESKLSEFKLTDSQQKTLDIVKSDLI